MKNLFKFWTSNRPTAGATGVTGAPLANVLPIIAGAAILGALSSVGMRRAPRPDRLVLPGLQAVAGGAIMGAVMASVGLLPKPVPTKRRIGPKDWSPRTGECLCRKVRP